MAGRILVLDDEENYAEMLQVLLRDHNYQVDMATRPERAIVQLEEIPYDLVVSDYKMPVMDGSDFLKKARELYPNLPFILLSGLMNTPELVKVANQNVTLVMEKPLDTAAFLAHVAKFTEAMTPEEKEALDRGVVATTSEGSEADQSDRGYPDEPRFFSASCAVSRRFMQDVWSASQAGSHLFMIEPAGGDSALALKDLSVWRGNVDKPLQEVDFESLSTGGEDQVRELLAHSEMSDVISVRLSSIDQITEAQTNLVKIFKTVDSAKSALFVFLIEGEVPAADFFRQTWNAGCALPALCQRPSDVAHYARRFARLYADRFSKPRSGKFSPEVAYALLVSDLPGNYTQLQNVISAAVQENDDAPITLEVIGDLLGEVVVPGPAQRLEELMKKAQIYLLEDEMRASGDSVLALARHLELDGNIQSKDDLRQMPLMNPRLATL